MIKELDTVVLTHDIAEHGLKRGDVGAVVHCYGDLRSEQNVAYEVEFVNDEGTTVALLTLNPDDIRPAQNIGDSRLSRDPLILFVGVNPNVFDIVTSAIHLSWPAVNPVTATTASEGVALVKWKSPDVVLVHPDFNDMTLGEAIQEMRRFTPVPLMVLGKDRDQGEVIAALASGADDYVTLPADLTEIMVRVWAMLRRVRVSENEGPLISGQLFINPDKQEVFLGDKRIPLTSTEFRLLNLLAKNSGMVVGRQILGRVLWGEHLESSDLIMKYIQRLRRKLGDDAREPMWIATVHGVGYQFVGPTANLQETIRHRAHVAK